MKSKALLWLIIAVVGIALAQSVQRQLNLLINGQATTSKAIVVNGQNYVPVSALKDLGISATVSDGNINLVGQNAGGANQRASLEACINEFAFNGIWRMRVTKVESTEAFGQKAWAITVELRNGTTKTLQPSQTGLADSSGLTLAFADNSTTVINASALSREYGNDLRDKSIPQGGAIAYQIKFDTAKADPPTKLLVQFDPSRLQKNLGVNFNTPDPSFRFKLDCSK